MSDLIIEKAKNIFYKVVSDFDSDPYRLLPHVPEVERWARGISKNYTKVDLEIVVLGAWLHDLGHYPAPFDGDHAIRSEERARKFLEQENYPVEKMAKVLHCVRAHRCKDVTPDSLEAKIVACADSASHMTEDMYFSMAKDDKKNGDKFRVYAKMERDYRDLALFPEVQDQLKEIYEAWKKLLQIYEALDLK